MKEIWKDIKGYEGLYQISNLGRVKSFSRAGTRTKKERILKTRFSYKGYERINLSKEDIDKTHFIHRLVAQAFIPNPYNYKEINHKDENSRNNKVSNLEWCDRSYNINYKNRNKKVADKLAIRVIQLKNEKIINEFDSMIQAQRKTKIPISNISKCCSGERKSAGGYKWKYADENI